MESLPQIVCYFCSESDHNARECPSLSDPLKEGFYSGGGSSSGEHSHDDED